MRLIDYELKLNLAEISGFDMRVNCEWKVEKKFSKYCAYEKTSL